jgi:ATP-dependent Lhr-like helicase
VDKLLRWFSGRGFTPYAFQTQAWEAYRRGESGLIHVPTGSGKTLAGFGGPMEDLVPRGGLQILYLSPLRAVIRDIEKSIVEVAQAVAPGAIVETRTGDTSSSTRARQGKRLPDILLTTPESLNLLLTREDFRAQTRGLKCVILDEWHELMGSKRGLQVELALSRLLPTVPEARVWAMSGTIQNLEECAQVAVGLGRKPYLISQKLEREVEVTTIVPEDPLSIPWAGHLGMRMLPEVLTALDPDQSTLIFCNTRSQAERWYQAILAECPAMAGAMALHHSAIDQKTRLFVEDAVKTGSIKWVVCTSSLDLGVDFGLVEKVVQIGSAKGVARVIQRAGRANHRPGEASVMAFVPTQAMEVAEIVAIKRAVSLHEVESRRPYRGAIDVLEQHLVTCACGEAVDPDEVYREVTQTVAYRDLTRETFDWMVSHLVSGGALEAYPQFKKLAWAEDESGRPLDPPRLRIASAQLARFHKMSIGTIVSDTTIGVFYTNRQKIGNVEESYLARMKKGDQFLFAGRVLELVMMKDMKAYVKAGKGKNVHTPRWMGGKLPISTAVCSELREVLDRASRDDFSGMSDSERSVLRPLLGVHLGLSRIPRRDEILVEFSSSREGVHCFLFPFEGRLVHEGMAALLAYRLSRLQKGTFGLSVNDYGVEILSEDKTYPLQEVVERHWAELWREEGALAELSHSVQVGEYSRRHFREIARVAGLVFSGYPAANKSARQMHVSTSLLFDVLSEYEPHNLLLHQSHQEVLERQFESSRLLLCLERLRGVSPVFVATQKFTPFAFPLVFERLAATVSSETLIERLDRMKQSWVGKEPVGSPRVDRIRRKRPAVLPRMSKPERAPKPEPVPMESTRRKLDFNIDRLRKQENRDEN